MRYGERTRSGTKINDWTKRPFILGKVAGYGVATGGTDLGVQTISNINYKVLGFTSDGTLTVSIGGLFDVLLIGGGGGSGGNPGNNESTGGGAGGSVLITTLYLPASTYTVDVGAGGPAGNHSGSRDLITRENGKPSLLYDATGATTAYYALAEGGGGGAGAWEDGLTNGQPMNMGGAGYRNGGGFGGAYSSQSPLCFAGGAANGSSGMAGGGAGAAGNGGNSTSTTTGGAGGAGRTTSFTGTSVTYASGGAGGNSGSAGASGSAIGGGGGGRQSGTTGDGTAGNAGAVYVRFKV